MFSKKVHILREWFCFNKYSIRTKHIIRFGSSSSSQSKEWRPSYIHMLGERPLQYDTIGRALERAANLWPHTPWLLSPTEGASLTFSQVLEEADILAAGFLETGLVPGDKIGICCPNSIRWITSLMAASRAGLIAVPINPVYQKKELEFCLKKVGIKALAVPSSFKNHGFYDIMRTIAPELGNSKPGELNSLNLPCLKSVIMLDDKKLSGVFTYKDIMSRGQSTRQIISQNQHMIQADSGFVILFTSGTTGQPKAALLSHFSYVNNSWEVGYRNEFSEKEHNKICLQVPLFHAFGLLNAMGSLQHGASLVIPSNTYNVDLSIQAIVQEKCNILTGTPTMYVDLVTSQQRKGSPIKNTEVAITGGAPCAAQLASHMRDYLHLRSIKSVYGMTESCVMFQSNPGDSIEQETVTVGKVFGHTEAKVIDLEGNTVPMGTPGELCVRSYANMQEYYRDPEKNSKIITHDNWLRTGDQIILEDDAYGKISGRLKDIIIRGGENIFPKEIEDFLNTHPDIIESHVFGVKDDRLGEEICASVRIREGAEFEYNKLKKFCQGAIAHFKIPKHLRIVDKFPVTPSGKIQKFILKEMVESGKL